MGYDLVSGGCGFVGRNLVKRLYTTTDDFIVFVDDLSVGNHPDSWLSHLPTTRMKDVCFYGEGGRVIFFQCNFTSFLQRLLEEPSFLFDAYGIGVEKFDKVYHLAAIVGGRATIDGDPMKVALDLSIDAQLFYWACKHKPNKLLYPSSSAAYPTKLQTADESIALSEGDIDFENLGNPDMTYGWSKLTGEYLAKIAAEHYGLKVCCIRPFSGYGEDQDQTYPIPAIAARVARKENPIEVWGTGHQGRDFVHIEDVLDCIALAMDKISDGTAVNIGSGKLTSFREIITVLAKHAGYAPEVKPLLDKPVGVHARYADTAHAKAVLGWEPKISLTDGMLRVYKAACESCPN